MELKRSRCFADRDDVYLRLCRLVPLKRVDSVLGDNPDMERVEALAGPTVTLSPLHPSSIGKN